MTTDHETIKKIIANSNTMISLDQVTPSADLKELGADSLDMMNILLAVQEKFNIEIPDEDIEGLNSIDKICEYINKKSEKTD